jgi:hypothetical protein
MGGCPEWGCTDLSNASHARKNVSSLWWILPDSPHTAKLLTEGERVIAVECLKSKKPGVKPIHHNPYQVYEALKEIKVWMLVAAVFSGPPKSAVVLWAAETCVE